MEQKLEVPAHRLQTGDITSYYFLKGGWKLVLIFSVETRGTTTTLRASLLTRDRTKVYRVKKDTLFTVLQEDQLLIW
jgi:hypothetical protein